MKHKDPLGKHILNTPMAIYVHGKDIANNYVFVIRFFCG